MRPRNGTSLWAVTALLVIALSGCGTSDAKLSKMLTEREKDEKVQEAILIVGQEWRSFSPQRQRRYRSLFAKMVVKDPRTIVRCASARTLGAMRSASAVPALLKALNDDNHLVRWDAALALGEIGNRKATIGLASTARQDAYADVRIAACQSLGKLGTPDAIHTLIEALRDHNMSVRHAAARGLASATGEPFDIRYEKWRRGSLQSLRQQGT